MAVAKTDLRDTRERARELRYEPTGSITATNVQKAIEQSASQPQAITGTPVVAGQSPYTVLAADSLLYVDTTAGPVIILLQASADRLGVPISIKDVGGNASNNNITVTPAAGETIDSTYTNAAPLVMNGDFMGYRLNPRTASYTVAP